MAIVLRKEPSADGLEQTRTQASHLQHGRLRMVSCLGLYARPMVDLSND